MSTTESGLLRNFKIIVRDGVLGLRLLEFSLGLLKEGALVVAAEQLQLLFDFFEHLDHASLFEDAGCLRQVILGLIRIVLDNVECANHFEGLSEVG